MFIIRYFLEYLSEGDVVLCTGIWYAIGLGVLLLLQGFLVTYLWTLNLETGRPVCVFELSPKSSGTSAVLSCFFNLLVII